jgi:hypothetical protein
VSCDDVNIHCNYRIVRLTSPNLDYIIIAGLAMTFISVYFRAYPKPIDDESTVIIVPLFCGVSCYIL